MRQGLNSESDNPLNLKPMYSLSSQACIRPIDVYFSALSLVLGKRQEKPKEVPAFPRYPMKKGSKSASSEIPYNSFVCVQRIIEIPESAQSQSLSDLLYQN